MKPVIKVLCLLVAVLALCAGCASNSDDGPIEVSFYLNDDTEDVFTAITGQPGSGVFMPAGTPNREGYLFNGWFLDKEGKEPYTGTADEAISVYAGWAAPVEVTFAGEGVVMIESQIVPKGGLVAPPIEPFRDGYFFNGWFEDELLTMPWDFSVRTVEADTTLYAGWGGVEHIVTLHLGNGMTEPFPVSGPIIDPPAAPNREGYNFGGWYMDESFTIPWDFMIDEIQGDMNLYAQWIELAPGETPAPTEAPKPTRTPRPSSNTPKPTATPKPSSSSAFTVTFDAGGGTAIASYANVPSGSTISKPNDPVRNGYTFGGWYKEATLSNAWNFSSDKVTANITLYARWASGFTVTFNTNGGSSVGSYTNVPYNSTISAPTAPTKSGFTFVRWYKESTLTSAWNFSSDRVVQNVTLYAMWAEAQDITVTFDPNNGKDSAVARTIKSGESITLPSAPPLPGDGYKFQGWFTAKSGGDPVGIGGASYTPKATITLYAKWEAPPPTPTPAPEPPPAVEPTDPDREEDQVASPR